MNEPSRQRPLESILHAYLQAIDAGQKPDREDLLRQHPEVADELREFFADQEKMDGFARSMRKAQIGDATVGPEASADGPAALPRIRYFGDYELLEEIARGGMGVVYKARQVSLNRVVALKMILAGQLASDAEVQRFRAEAEAAANLDHPNIVPIYEVGEHEGQHFFSMKLIVQGPKISRDSKGSADQRQTADLVAKVARAVHYAHQRGIIHRDLKPANILVDERGQPHVTDFGLAKRTEGDATVSQSGAVVGTPAYMAPEQAAGKKGLTTAADVYSLGAILYELLAGKPPFVGKTAMDILLQVMDHEPNPPRQVQPAIDRDLETICLKCLEKNPQGRFSSAQAIAEDLERWLTGEPILARPSTTWERAVKWARRKPALAALMTVSVAAAAVLLIGGLVFNAQLQFALRDVTTKQVELAQANRLADERAARAKGILLSANSAIVRPSNPGLALLLGIEGAELSPGLLANNALLEALDACREQKTLVGHRDAVLFATFSHDGRRVLTTSADKTARIWNALTGALVTTLQGHEEWAASASFSPDDSRVATISQQDKTARTWDAASGQPLATMRLRGKQDSQWGSCSVRFSPDGRRVAAAFGGFPDCTAGIWETDTGKEVALLKGHQGPVTSAVFSADGKRVVTASLDRTARIWDAESGKELLTLKGHKCAILHALFSPDDQRVLTTGLGYESVIGVSDSGEATFQLGGFSSSTAEDMAGRIWDASSGNEIAALSWPEKQRGFVRTALFSRD